MLTTGDFAQWRIIDTWERTMGQGGWWLELARDLWALRGGVGSIRSRQAKILFSSSSAKLIFSQRRGCFSQQPPPQARRAKLAGGLKIVEPRSGAGLKASPREGLALE